MKNACGAAGVVALPLLLIGGCTGVGNEGPPGAGDVLRFRDQEISSYPFQDANTAGPPEAAGVSLEDVAAGKVVGCAGGFDCIPHYSYPELVRAVDAHYVDDGEPIAVLFDADARTAEALLLRARSTWNPIPAGSMDTSRSLRVMRRTAQKRICFPPPHPPGMIHQP